MKKKQKCTDNRCLYLIEDKNQLKKNFSTLTTKTREGKGLWEKCNICGLSINRTGIQKNISVYKAINISNQKKVSEISVKIEHERFISNEIYLRNKTMQRDISKEAKEKLQLLERNTDNLCKLADYIVSRKT